MMFQDPPSSTTGNELPITREFLEIDCPDSCYFLNIPLDGLVSLQSLRFQSTSRCQEIYDSQENYIGTCTRIPRTSSAGFCVEEMANDVGGVDWNTTQLNLDERLLVSGYLVVKFLYLPESRRLLLEKRAWVNENSVELAEQRATEMLRNSQETFGNERNYMRGYFQSPEGVAMLLQKSQLKDTSSAHSGEIIARLNALELRLEARLDRLERLLTAVLNERTNQHGRI